MIKAKAFKLKENLICYKTDKLKFYKTLMNLFSKIIIGYVIF
jgi:hypothetical protein